MATSSPCRHHQYGHCKFGQYCSKQHTAETCQDIPCNNQSCNRRHPKVCRYFLFTGKCKFNEHCSYLHKHVTSMSTAANEKEIAKLRKDIQSLSEQINEMKQLLDSFSIISKPKASNTSKLSTESSSFSITQTDQENLVTWDRDRIPQLDGQQDELVHSQELQAQPMSKDLFQCETCQKIFDSESEFMKHDEMQFCCDDCNICYLTQLESDLHALKVHPDEYYAKNYIPEATKVIFAKQRRVGP